MNLTKLMRNVSQSLLVLSLASTGVTAFAASATPPLPKALGVAKPPVQLTMLEFSAGWCVNCQLLKPAIKKLSQDAGPALRIINLDIDQPASQPYVKAYQVLATPSIILFDASGKPVQRLESELTAGQLRTAVMSRIHLKK